MILLIPNKIHLVAGLWKIIYFAIQLITLQASANLFLTVTTAAYVYDKSKNKPSAMSALLSYKYWFLLSTKEKWFY